MIQTDHLKTFIMSVMQKIANRFFSKDFWAEKRHMYWSYSTCKEPSKRVLPTSILQRVSEYIDRR